jgi:hypothetical protein
MSFDAEKFMTSTSSGPMSTQPVLCPEGEFRAFIDDGEKAISFMNGTSQAGNEWHKMSVLCNVADDNVKAQLKRDKVLVPFSCFLDIKGDGLDTEEGKNVSLGRLRKAVGQNDASAWAPAMLKGKGPFMIKVSHRSDPKDPEIKYAEVTKVSAIVS